jgi:putative Holliday junction resolvase
MRVLGLDVGERRIGVAISDPSRTLARPLSTITVTGAADAIDRVSAMVTLLEAEDDGLDAIVVGVPCRLDGTPTTATPHVLAFIEALKARTT